MTQPYETTRISRRKVLAGLGAVGVASGGAGLGTSAFLSDRETAPGRLEAGRLDLLVDYRATYSPWDYQPTDSDGTPYPVGDTMVDETTGETGPMYVVGMAPDLREGDGTVVDNATWSAANLALDACRPLSEQLPLDVDGDDDSDVFRGNGKIGGESLDNYSASYVDGRDGILFALDDVKPGDRGEATISLHVCNNPAYLWLDGAGTDTENTRYEPEIEAGDENSGPFGAGELAEFVWVRAFYDPDCSNTLGDDEVVIYEGSLTGFIDHLEGGLALDPVRDAEIPAPSTSGTGDLLDVIAVSGNPTCGDFGLDGVKLEDDLDALGSTSVTTDEGEITVTVTTVEDGEGVTIEWTSEFGIDHVVVKGGNGSNVYVYDEATAGTGLTTPFGNGISHVSFCYDTDDTVPPAAVNRGICYEPGTHCIAVEWYLPSDIDQPDGMGFGQLPSDAIDTTTVNGSFPSLADELVDTFGLSDADEIDVNVVQSDTAAFTLTVTAVQCRHNTNATSPFETSEDVTTP